jgi:phosphoglycerate kinase
MKSVRKVQSADLKGNIVLLRVDHNVVKKGRIIDPYRIEASLDTIEYILSQGGKIVLMTHVGRPRNKETGKIDISENTSVKPIVEYLCKKGINAVELHLDATDEDGISHISYYVVNNIFKKQNPDVVYIPNTRWFKGEEAKDEAKEVFGKQLAETADIFVNDAFGSWQPHASTIVPPQFIPAYAGLLMQKEIRHLDDVLQPKRPFLAVVGGAKFDTKIKPLSALLELADHLMLGGVIYNAYLCVKYKLDIKGVTEADKQAAQDFVQLAMNYPAKVIEPEYLVESDIPDGKIPGKFRTLKLSDLTKDQKLNYILDISAESFQVDKVKSVFAEAETIFINAVMGFTPHFTEGTFALDTMITGNFAALKLFGGGDTLQELNILLPDIYQMALQDPSYYFFTGGGTILKVIAENSVWGLEPVAALIDNDPA